MTKPEKERRARLVASQRRRGLSLAGGGEDWWPAWEYLPRHPDSDPLVIELNDECDAGSGPITDLYVDGLLRIAAHATPRSTRWRRPSRRRRATDREMLEAAVVANPKMLMRLLTLVDRQVPGQDLASLTFSQSTRTVV